MLVQQNTRVILGGDFNCTTSLIPGYQIDDCGTDFETLLLQINLVIKNSPDPTYSSINDYILARSIVITHYQVLDNDSHSDHSIITFDADLNATMVEPIFHTNTVKLSAGIGNLVIATPVLHTQEEIEGLMGNLTFSLQDCIEAASKRITVRHKRLP